MPLNKWKPFRTATSAVTPCWDPRAANATLQFVGNTAKGAPLCLNGADAKDSFESNTGAVTTSETEWKFIVAPEKGVDYPERAGYREHHPTWCRVALKLDDGVSAVEQTPRLPARRRGGPLGGSLPRG